MKEANLTSADLRGALLKNANLQDAILVETKLQRANLKNAKLNGANLKKANLEGADLEGANFRGAYLQRTILKNATGLTVDKLSSVVTLFEANLNQGIKNKVEEKFPYLFSNEPRPSSTSNVIKEGGRN